MRAPRGPAKTALARAAAVAARRLGARVRPRHVALAGIVLLGLGLRLAWVLHAQTVPLGGDPAWYYNVAEHVARGEGFVADHEVLTDQPILRQPTAFWPPLYPLTLAAFWKLFGIGVTSAKVLNALLGALTIPFVYGLGRRLFRPAVGLLAALGFAVLPNVLLPLPVLLSEPLFIVLFTAGLWLVSVLSDRASGRWWTVALFGLVVGLAALTRGQGLVLLPVAALVWAVTGGLRLAALRLGLTVLVALAVITPWTVRNWVVLDTPVLIATNAGVNLRMGHAPYATGGFVWPEDPVDGVPSWRSLRRPEWEVRSYREYIRRAIDYALNHPREELDLAREKVLRLYRSEAAILGYVTTLGITPVTPAWLGRNAADILDVSYYAVLAAALASLPATFVGERRRLVVGYLLFFWTAFHVLFMAEPRFHVPLYPVLLVAAVGGGWTYLEGGSALVRALARWVTRRRLRLALAPR